MPYNFHIELGNMIQYINKYDTVYTVIYPNNKVSHSQKPKSAREADTTYARRYYASEKKLFLKAMFGNEMTEK